jgi:hypothetical protein
MNKVIIMVISLLIWFYSGIAYYGYSHESTNEKLERLHHQIQSLNTKFNNWLTITITE